MVKQSVPAEAVPQAMGVADAAGTSPAATVNPVLKLSVEFGPLLTFFGVNYLYNNVFLGTAVFMAATAVALTTARLLWGRIPLMPLVSGVFIMVFGALTLVLHDDQFIKMKPTIVNLLFASILFAGLMRGHSLLKYLFGDAFSLTDEGWRKLTGRWAVFFICLALLNEVVWRSFSTSFWLSFKLIGIMPLTVLFGMAQIGLLKQHGLDPPDQGTEPV